MAKPLSRRRLSAEGAKPESNNNYRWKKGSGHVYTYVYMWVIVFIYVYKCMYFSQLKHRSSPKRHHKRHHAEIPAVFTAVLNYQLYLIVHYLGMHLGIRLRDLTKESVAHDLAPIYIGSTRVALSILLFTRIATLFGLCVGVASHEKPIS